MIRILIPTDFSDNARNAINYAQKLFKNERCTIYLVNTYTPIIYTYDVQMNIGGYLGDAMDVIRKNSEDKLDELKKKLSNEMHTVETLSSFNTLTDEVQSLVSKHIIDVLIMGTKGATGAKEVLFGSNAIHIIKKAKCPVLAIPDGYFFEKPSDILFPTDYKVDYSESQLMILKKIAGLYNSKIRVLHVSYGRDLNEVEITNKIKLGKLLIDFDDTYYNEKNQEITEAINEFQKEKYVQLLMMINNKHSFFENLLFKPVINQIGFHLNVPFLVIPSRKTNKS